jgi:uncharacterized membrane protein YeaQ/YmgE (transglycosylase-associated protein family)
MEEGSFLIAVLVVCFVCGALGYAVGDQKNQGGLGAVLGIMLGPVGVLIAAVLPKSK